MLLYTARSQAMREYVKSVDPTRPRAVMVARTHRAMRKSSAQLPEFSSIETFLYSGVHGSVKKAAVSRDTLTLDNYYEVPTKIRMEHNLQVTLVAPAS